MAVDLADLIPDVKSEVSPPGSDLFPNTTNTDWLNMLRNAFWEAVLDGVIVGYTEEDGSVIPKSGDTEIPREQQQIIIYYAGTRVLKNRLSALNALFRSKAGSVEYETQQSAQVLKALLDEAVRRRNYWLDEIANSGGATGTYYFDGIKARDAAMGYGETHWIR